MRSGCQRQGAVFWGRRGDQPATARSRRAQDVNGPGGFVRPGREIVAWLTARIGKVVSYWQMPLVHFRVPQQSVLNWQLAFCSLQQTLPLMP